jgi:transcriptional regulator with XRE-family HTH domain
MTILGDAQYKLHPLIDILQDARRAQGVSTMKLAEKSGIGRPAIARYECGEAFPNVHKLTQWAEALGYEIILRKKP